MSTDNTYDIVIVGAGLGGLLSAVMLAKEGLNVCVVEQDKQIGGCLQTFSFEKNVFDSCVHYIGGLGKGHTLNSIFYHAGIMRSLQLAEYDKDAFDKIIFGDETTEYPLAQGKENFVAQLTKHFPKERQNLEKYIKSICNIGDHFPLYRLRHGDAHEKSTVAHLKLTETINNITQNKKLQSVLTGNNLLYAGVSDKTPYYLHALVTESYIHSSHKIVPGSSQISKFLWKELIKHGGQIIRNTRVTKLTEEQGKITHLNTADGEQIFGEQFIANIHPQALLGILDSKIIRPAYRKRINGLEQTISSFMVNLVLAPKKIPIRHHNLYWNATEDVWAAANYTPSNWPANYAIFYTEDKESRGYAESISILSYMHYNDVAKWENTFNKAGEENDRGNSYNEFKELKKEQLLNKVYQRIPELKDNITAWKIATPLTYRDYTGTTGGSLYGILKDVNKQNETTISTRTKIPNLLLTGQNVNMHGVLGVSITAVATVGELVGMDYLLDKISSNK